MTKRAWLLGSTVSLALTGLTAATAQEGGLAAKEHRVVEQLVLSAAKGEDRAARVRSAMAAKGLGGATLVLTQERVGRNGAVHQRFEQRVDGLPIYGAGVVASFDGKGRLTRMQERTVGAASAKATGERGVAPARIEAEAAIRVAVERHFPGALIRTPARPDLSGEPDEGFDRGRGMDRGRGRPQAVPETMTPETQTFAADFFFTEPTAKAVIVARDGGKLERGWLVETWSGETNELYHTLIGAEGDVVHVEDRTARDQYGIFPDHPGNTSQVIAQGPGAGNAQSPAGWLYDMTHSRFLIQGNNTAAYLDTDNNNAPDAGGEQVTDGSFIRAANLSGDPSTIQNKEVAIQSLFYWNNVIHDELYRHGFTESAGNFQNDNFGRGGAGGDSVYAEAQDGGGVNNANMATPGDGSHPRMQMYIWDLTNPRRDGDLDSDIIWHEYGHGLTWRMIGSMSGSISGAIGEGMSDVLAILINDDDRVGEYSANNAAGIRRYRYTNYPLDITDFTGTSVHRDGEIYAATIWKLYDLYKANGLNRDTLMGDLIEGMNFTAPGPDYMDMRDGILAAAPASRDCLVWEAFAAFKMGQGSSMTSSRGTGSTALPSSCTGGGEPQPPTASFPQDGVWYELQNVATNRFLDTDGSGRVDQNGTAGRDDRQFRFVRASDGTYWIDGRASGVGALDTQNRGSVRYVSSATPSGDDKRWRVTQLSNGTVRFENVRSGRGYLASSGSTTVIYNTGATNDAATWRATPVN